MLLISYITTVIFTQNCSIIIIQEIKIIESFGCSCLICVWVCSLDPSLSSHLNRRSICSVGDIKFWFWKVVDLRFDFLYKNTYDVPNHKYSAITFLILYWFSLMWCCIFSLFRVSWAWLHVIRTLNVTDMLKLICSLEFYLSEYSLILDDES